MLMTMMRWEGDEMRANMSSSTYKVTHGCLSTEHLSHCCLPLNHSSSIMRHNVLEKG